ncbi:MAG TPA: beta-ketoacyl-ACP synthase III [Fimbriimonadaceae bacterium]|nr:beta-ketoacyl-ACP synthase III [Fimbriimonadaceae bacterium]
MSIQAVVQGIGHAVPDKVLTNFDLEKIVDTSDEWIVQRTGIRERRMCGPDETPSTLGTLAAKEALASAGIDSSEVDLVIVGTVTGDMLFPSTSCLIQAGIAAGKAGAFDVGAACAGFIYATSVGSSMIRNGEVRTAVIVGVDTLTKFIDWTDRSTCVLFGDGAGAIVLRGEENTDRGVIGTVLSADGAGAKYIDMEVGGSRYPACSPLAEGKRNKIFMAGAEVYRFAVVAMGDACCRLLDQVGMTPEDIDLFVPHQANLRIIESAAKRLNLPDEKVFVNVHKYGNTSGGSIPIGLYEAEKEGRLKKGMIGMTVGFGAGVVWGANLIRW